MYTYVGVKGEEGEWRCKHKGEEGKGRGGRGGEVGREGWGRGGVGEGVLALGE